MIVWCCYMSICYVWLATASRPPSTATLLQIYKEKMKGQRKREKNLRLDLFIINLLTSRLWNAVSKKVYVHFYDNSFSSSTVVYFLTTTVTTVTTGRTGATLYVTRWHTTGTTRLLLPTCFSRQLSCFFNDNRDNNDNGKDGRNDLCHEVTYNWDKKITVDNSIFSQAQGNFSSNLLTEQNLNSWRKDDQLMHIIG